MTRATNSDGTPWWVSTGPPQPAAPSQSVPSDDSQTDSMTAGDSLFGITSETQAAALNAGLNLITAVLEIVAKPLNAKDEPAVAPHDPQTCGICPLCVGLETLKEHDPALAELVESAMAGVTASAEKLTTLLPDLAERAAEALAGSLVKLAFKNMSGK